MSPTVSRGTLEGRIYNDLRNLAKRNDRDPAEYYTLYALEGFLARLTQSALQGRLVLKGGVLLAAYSERRPTRDVDLSATGFANDIEACQKSVRSVVMIEREDGLTFDLGSIKGETIRDESSYSGTRVYISAQLASANLRFHVDMNFGDPINPPPATATLPLLLGGKMEVLAYPLSMLLAEKIVTAIDRGAANTRWRDFLDIAKIMGSQVVAEDDLSTAIGTVGVHRCVDLRSLSEVLEGMGKTAQKRWAIWRKKQRLESESPENFEELLSTVICFVDPVIMGKVAGSVWDPCSKSWSCL